MFYSILNNKFDSNLLVDSNLNKPFDSDNDIFYTPLLNDLVDRKLYDSVINIRNNKISLGNLSHVPYLLTWSLQQTLNTTSFECSSYGSDRDLSDIKYNLTKYIENVKRVSLVSSCLLKLRLIGFCNRNNLLYRRLRDAYRNHTGVSLICRINNKIVRHEGRLLFFDLDLNLLLMNRSIIFIRLVSSS